MTVKTLFYYEPEPPTPENTKHPISARRTGTNKIVSTGPDVCWTPMGSKKVPVAYNSIAHFDAAVRCSTDVRDNGSPDFNLNSRARHVEGHAAGKGKGVKVPGYRGYAAVVKTTNIVYSNGYPVVRDGDPAMINAPSVMVDEQQRPMETLQLAGGTREECNEYCAFHLEKLLPFPGSDKNTWDFHKCVNRCMGLT